MLHRDRGRRQVLQSVTADLELVPGPDVLEALFVEDGTCHSGDDEDGAEVNDVTAVALLVLAQERAEGLKRVLFALANPGADCERVFLDNRADRERAEPPAHDRVVGGALTERVPHHQARDQADDRGPAKLFRDARQ